MCVSVAGLHHQLAKNAGLARVAVEIEIHRELLRLLVDDVEGAVEVGDKETLGAADLFAQRVHPGQQQIVARALGVDRSGHRHHEEVLDLEGHLRGRRGDPNQTDRQSKAGGSDSWADVHDGLSIEVPAGSQGFVSSCERDPRR